MGFLKNIFKRSRHETDRKTEEAIKQLNVPLGEEKKRKPNRRVRRFFVYGKKSQNTKEGIRRVENNKAKRRKANKLASVKRQINKGR